MSSRYDPALFYPSPSSRFHSRQWSEPPPSPVSSHAYDNDCEFDSIFYKQQRGYPGETDSEDEQSPTVCPPSSRSSNGTSSPDNQPPPLTPMSPVPSEKTMSISGVSLSAVVPGTPVGRRMSLMPPSCVPGLSEVESDEWNEDDDDLETETETETEPHSWVGHDNNLHIADSVAALYAATNNVADSRHPSWGHSQSKARPRIPSMTARVAEAAASQHHSRDSLFEMLAQEKLVHSKHPFATPNPSTASSATPVAPKATSSMTSLLSPANVTVAPAQSVSGPPTPSPPANRPLVVVSTQAISTQSRASRLMGHSRALTTTDVSASDPIPLPEPPFSAPADASRHPVSYQSTMALSAAQASPLLEPRPAAKPPQHAPLTILTNVNINTNAFATVSPVANTGRWCSHRTVIAGKPCCHVSVSDDEEPRKEPTSRKSLIASKVFRRARSYTTKDAPQLHHELQHSVQVTHDYHYTKRVPDVGNPVSTTTVTARPLTWCEPATATTVTKTAKRSPPVGQRHITPHGPVPRTPSKSSMSSSDAAQAPKSSPQHILPPSELHTYRKRHNHVPPPLEIPVANLHRSSFMVVADDDDEVNRSRRNSAYVITYRPPSRLHSRNPSHDSNGSSATVSSKGSSESRGSETKSTPKAKFKPKVHIAKGKTADRTHNAYAELHSYRRAHNPTPRKASFNDGDDEDSDSDSDDENLELASPFAPSDWGYERYGFKMPVA